ncbi:hypothetical protein P170DRAFT_512694 [Aspergillus steynii IBT 23096]|uniref:F-box domain-containing protein n=1 Tax=Aspergillus steynii IBT 23096 TaxID=1392250 RepID=A0A2I2FZQ2_9EURO|nr:uncharacterized protein P170DRAFT_512694 [Aspergillus steynii IBT 23096]PLB46120.1 hypothetical protein P170DRAFT_512694 [Aspergillus steynii IBT 23096]
MAQQQASTLFFIPELMEQILLHLDMRTLLTSARVCSSWNTVIRDSPKIQTALFFRPMPETETQNHPRTTNPLITQIMWPQFFSTYFNTDPPRKIQWGAPVSALAPLKDRLITDTIKPYLRAEASWRKMLLKQPPTSRICFIENEALQGTIHFYAAWDLGRSMRLDDLERSIEGGRLIPSRDPLYLYADAEKLADKMDSWYREEKKTALEDLFPACDLIVHSESNKLFSFPSRPDNADWHLTYISGTELDNWIESTRAPIRRCSGIEPVWTPSMRKRHKKQARLKKKQEKEEAKERRKHTCPNCGYYNLYFGLDLELDFDISGSDSGSSC